MTESCPFSFNFDPTTFKVGDTISYRVPALGDFAFPGTITEVHDDYIVLDGGDGPKRASRESRPVVNDADALS
jgi:hypothetical protein